MREIKFRGKTLYGKWVYGWLFKANNKYYIVESTAYISKDYYGDEIFEKQHFEEVDPATVGQYTGQKDKAGTEIYEGDKLECKSRVVRMMSNEPVVPEQWDIRHYHVVYHDGAYKYQHDNGHIDGFGLRQDFLSKYYTVIGTIHDEAEGEATC